MGRDRLDRKKAEYQSPQEFVESGRKVISKYPDLFIPDQIDKILARIYKVQLKLRIQNIFNSSSVVENTLAANNAEIKFMVLNSIIPYIDIHQNIDTKDLYKNWYFEESIPNGIVDLGRRVLLFNQECLDLSQEILSYRNPNISSLLYELTATHTDDLFPNIVATYLTGIIYKLDEYR